MKLCVIPARGGSKRIPRKNIKEFNGRPIIAYSIEAALNSNLFDVVMVSTEDEEIAEISRQFGAEVPFIRSKKNADDFSGPGDVIAEVLANYQEIGKEFDIACCIYATSPLIKISRLIQCYELLIESGGTLDVVFPVGKYNSPIWRSFRMENDSAVYMNFPEFEKSRSQDLMDSYYDAGQFYWFYPNKMMELKNKNVFGTNKGAIVLDDIEVQDIDQMDDWEIAEFKHAYLMQKSHKNV